MRTDIYIDNLLNGVSQQPASIRLKSQAESQLNCVSSLTEGLKKRPPSERITTLTTSNLGNIRTYLWDKGDGSRFIVGLQDRDLKVWSLDGTPCTVSFPDGKNYLDCGDPRLDLATYPKEDYFFVTNKLITPAFNGATTATRNPEALIVVKGGNYGKAYQIIVNNVQVAYFRTPNGSNAADSQRIGTDYIAQSLYSGFNGDTGNGAAGKTGDLLTNLTTLIGGTWATFIIGSTIWISRTSGPSFSINATDDTNTDAMVAIKDKVQNFGELPAKAPSGYIVKVAGENGRSTDDFYVKYETASSGDGMGVWKETIAPGILYAFNAATMPHALIQTGATTFSFQALPWANRLVGDATTNSAPSFVGTPIRTLFFQNNRLCLTAGENVIASEDGEFFNMFRTTVSTLVASDPIDQQVASDIPSVIEHALTFDTGTILIAENRQFRLSGAEPMDARTGLVFKTVGKYKVDINCTPVAVNDSLFFVSPKGTNYSVLLEMVINSSSDRYNAVNVGEHAPKYIKSGLLGFAAAASKFMLFPLYNISQQAADTQVYWLYQWYYTLTNDIPVKQQSALHRWSKYVPDTVVGLHVVETTLYIVTAGSAGCELYQMRLDDFVNDGDFGYMVNLDHRVYMQGTYSSVTGKTTWNPGYLTAYTGTLKVVRDDGFTVGPGLEISGVTNNDGVLTATGDYSESSCFIGLEYDQEYQFSKIFPRKSDEDNAPTVTEGYTTVEEFTISYINTGFFQVQLDYTVGTSTDSYTINWTEAIDDLYDAQGSLQLQDGQFKFLVSSPTQQVSVKLKNSSFAPACFTNAVVAIDYSPLNKG